MHRQSSDSTGTETGDGLDGRGGESRIIEVGHIVELSYSYKSTVTFYKGREK
jgi:hypothetical protein